MKIRSFLLAAALVPAIALAQGDKPKPADPHAMGGPEMEAMMKAASPGEHHKPLQRYVGDWTYTMKMWMAPEQPAMESGGTMHAESILGGRYVQSVYKGEFMGHPFEGRSTDGYDNVGKQYVGSWVDNVGTGIMNSTGTCEAACKVFNMTADMLDPMSGQKISTKSVVTWSDDNHFRMEMFMVDPKSGQPVKTMEMTAKRK
ncbi:MAG: hypothetical protein QOJ16_2294 [Acidobacteriota bacterium]|jgi:hypothetical protein|nr:hypothetical protein [Acidobacteriota bacterium]